MPRRPRVRAMLARDQILEERVVQRLRGIEEAVVHALLTELAVECFEKVGV